MIKKAALVVGMGIAILMGQPVVADEEWDKLEADFDQAHAKWEASMEKLKGKGLLRAARKVRAEQGMELTAGIGFEQIWAIGDVLRGHKPKEGQMVRPPYEAKKHK